MRSSETLRPAPVAQRTTSGMRRGSWVRSSVARTCGTADCMPNETRVKPAAASSASDSGVTESGLASVVTSASGASPQADRTPSSRRARSRAGSMVGVPPPTNTVDTGRSGTPASCRTRCARPTSRSAVVAYAAWSAPPPSSDAV
ncbi:hypothetical protein BJF88_00390 [Cellulosimicrobium sp. CUA-896]|nr:hypothetical protein BJF88_00390 [Cellulosimicrobium sp. CUA-896]